MLITFCFGVSSNLSQEKSPTGEILGNYFLQTIVPRKYLPKISTVGLFSCDKFEETPKQNVINMSKLNKFTLIKYEMPNFVCFIKLSLLHHRFENDFQACFMTCQPSAEPQYKNTLKSNCSWKK